jgi:hypothetical protein
MKTVLIVVTTWVATGIAVAWAFSMAKRGDRVIDLGMRLDR